MLLPLSEYESLTLCREPGCSNEAVYLAPQVCAEHITVEAPAVENQCHIMEYDGAYKCSTHDRTWGAVPEPDEPCAGASEKTLPTPSPDDAIGRRMQSGKTCLQDAAVTCAWAHDESDDAWETECGEVWQFVDGDPRDNRVRFCHGCGNPIDIFHPPECRAPESDCASDRQLTEKP